MLERGLLVEDESGIYLSARALDAVRRLHAGAREYLATLQPLPPDDLEELARQLERAVEAILQDPALMPRQGSHLAGSRSIATFEADAPAMVRIEQGVYDLWMARDDAHMAAWRDAAQRSVDDAHMRYFIVHLHRLLDPETESGGA